MGEREGILEILILVVNLRSRGSGQDRRKVGIEKGSRGKNEFR